jgi:hypothetical protein
VRKCLEKDPEDRWQSARDVAAELQWIAEGGSRAGLPGIVSTRRRVREGLAWTIAGLAAVAGDRLRDRLGPAALRNPAPIVRFQVPNPKGVLAVGPPVLSPDGRMLAFDAAQPGRARASCGFARSTRSSRGRSRGTEGALRPIWSPDSRSIAFMAGESCGASPWPGGLRRRSGTRSTEPTARGGRRA